MEICRMYSVKHIWGLLALSGYLVACQPGTGADGTDPEMEAIMHGAWSEERLEENPYLTAGDKTYIVGKQDGNFPDMGGHTPGEMGGVWNQRIKLLDGFWVRMGDEAGNTHWLERAERYTSYPFGSGFGYAPLFDNALRVERFQFCPSGRNGVVVTYTLENLTDAERTFTFDFVAKTDLLPVWSSDQIGLTDGEDALRWDAEGSFFEAKDGKNDWYAAWGADRPADTYRMDASTYVATQGLGKSGSASYTLTLPVQGRTEIAFAIAGSTTGAEEAQRSFRDILTYRDALLDAERERYAAVVRRGRIDIPDKRLQEVYNWCKINTEWLVADLDGVGRFQGAGAIEYPWLFGCDNSYTLQGVVASGDPALAKRTLRVIREMSERANGNGRILHEMAFNAFVSNKGNTQETAHFIVAVWDVFRWTGDRAFLNEMYPSMKKGIDFLLGEMDTNGNMFPEGYGIMEVRGLNAELIDVAVYTQQALEAMSRIAALMDEESLSENYAGKAVLLKEKINDSFWDEEEGVYCDFYGTREQALKTTQGAIEQIRQTEYKDPEDGRRHLSAYEAIYDRFEKYPAGTQRGWLTNKNWVISTPMETGIAPQERAIAQLDKVRSAHCGEYGPYLSAVERDRMMTIATGVQAVAECAYGRVNEAMWYVNRIADTFGRVLPGSICEMMPDYGCPAQAWTLYGMAVPLIRYVYGIQPDAHEKRVTFSPCLPEGWDRIAIHDLPIGDNMISYEVERTEKGLVITLSATDPGWHYEATNGELRIRE